MAIDKFRDVPDADPKHPLLSRPAAAAGRRGIKGVVVFDYGQGDCNAIVDGDGQPVVFFDMGGGKQTGSLTHPWHTAWSVREFASKPWRDKVPNVKIKPTVILSHWDCDHYSTAYYLTHRNMKAIRVPSGAPTVAELKWLVPRQCKHPSKLYFAKDLTKVSCWPAAVPEQSFHVGKKTVLRVERCIGSKKRTYDANLDGLALILQRVNFKGAVLEEMLLPGDAPYAYIPSCKHKRLTKLVALLAFHHGSATHLGETKRFIPAPAGKKPRIVYTYGVKPDGRRCYGHPSANAVKAYENEGWTRPWHPGGSFKRWPPRASDLGDPGKRADVLLKFATRDVEVLRQISTREAPETGRQIALRR